MSSTRKSATVQDRIDAGRRIAWPQTSRQKYDIPSSVPGVSEFDLSFRLRSRSNHGEPMLFGQYLINIGAIQPEDVLAVLDDQELRVEHFGRIAVKRGYLTASRLLAMLDDQVLHRRKVGETAIAYGYMTEVQVKAVLSEQKEQRRPIGALLVERGAISESQLRKHLSDYFALEPTAPSTARSSTTIAVSPAINSHDAVTRKIP